MTEVTAHHSSRTPPAVSGIGYRVIAYDRRGFGYSEKHHTGYSFDTLTENLQTLFIKLELSDVILVGFSLGGGEVARFFSKYGTERVHLVVFDSAVSDVLNTPDNPDGPVSTD
ncbi:alpha/beta fold hydrolase [Frigoribacterium sp. CG_9.8]|uniref:alpha/beta fold hydrolase n=1 Tax=Frigoribacterium sp. CG_9.8 TaxID=2787733 RepID=UPI0018C914F9|nr:pimeloyl-ACP methyl ester carboxylesterase [Frigoribacterium sp. CG_9.8]